MKIIYKVYKAHGYHYNLNPQTKALIAFLFATTGESECKLTNTVRDGSVQLVFQLSLPNDLVCDAH